ncbi:Alpha-(1,3)-fucosyltransferase C [Armadillidium vulgare]|nr:Alpha-(1,3)-fucosyltransferase C [Armadillidium vulgare]
MVSHCPTSSRREELIQQMNNHMKIDVYGACGNKRCGNPAYIYRVNTMKNESCNNLYMKNNKSLNRIAGKDYVTEKLFRSLKLGVLPVVFGGADYNNMAPPNSFINVNQFQNYANLVKYLLKVSDDHILYNSYLQWREDYDIDVGTPYKPLICDLCKKLHEQTPDR